MVELDVYHKLAEHLSQLGMGYPVTEDLLEILRESFSPREALVALAIPNKAMPLETISLRELSTRVDLPREELEVILDGLESKNLLYIKRGSDEEMRYGLLQVGFGFPQVFFWAGKDHPLSRKMASLIPKYFNRQVTRQAYARATKPFRYIPVEKALEPGLQAVFPFHLMEGVISKAKRFAVCHCSCRVIASLRGRPCSHPLEVCIKFDEMAEYVIVRGLGREIDRDEAHALVKQSEEAGLVHFVDNAEGDVKHNCNCCGCACWNVGVFKRRKIPRDVLMATYFIRHTDPHACVGCGQCVEICPVDAVNLQGDFPVVDQQWCIGCGVCALRCPNGAITVRPREDKSPMLPAKSFLDLHRTILTEAKGS